MLKSTILFVLFLPTSLLAKNIIEPIWSEVTRSYVEQYLSRLPLEFPDDTKYFALNDLALDNSLAKVPFRNSNNNKSNTILQIPNISGSDFNFKIYQINILDASYAENFPEIRTYEGIDTKNPSIKLRLTISPYQGLSGAVYSGDKTLFIDLVDKESALYALHKKITSAEQGEFFKCDLHKSDVFEGMREVKLSSRGGNDGTLRTYRLALACNGEYADYHGGTKASALAAMAATINRVNGIYERDLGVSLEIIDNSAIIFLDASTDPYSGGVNDLLDQNQTVCDDEIGPLNYDIGHLFGSGGGGGLAGFESVCSFTRKAYGVTLRGTPEGDRFDIDYVAHEIGHQLGANHTQNNDCQRSVVSVEPGSASTIMGYAGICAPNVQSTSDDYFHGSSIHEIWSFITTGNGSTCGNLTVTGNTAPVINLESTRSIPKSTPFKLTGSVTDINGEDELTYCWEQIDTEIGAMPPQSTNKFGPMFRSLSPKTDSVRYFPDFHTVLFDSLSNDWEVVPSVDREMNFRLTVRDNASPIGNSNAEDLLIRVEDATPFTVSTDNVWESPAKSTVSWEVGQTNSSPINCETVNIFLSIDGGNTFDIELAMGAPNTGSAEITVPTVEDTDEAIVMVEAADNVFYNISNKFSISAFSTIQEFQFSGMSVYPNPATTEVTVEYLIESGNVKFQMQDLQGKIVYEKASSAYASDEGKEVIDLSGIASGVYVLTVNYGARAFLEKIVVK